MPIQVDINGDGIYDKDNILNNGVTDIIDETGDGKLDVNLDAFVSTANINGALFGHNVIGAGTGTFNDFLGIQASPTEFGFNGFAADPSNPEIKTSQNFTHPILLSDLAIITVNGVQYYQFLLDANESNSQPNPHISLDTFRISLSTNGQISTLAGFNALPVAYDMDSSGDISVLFTDSFSSGSGNSDLAVLIPVETLVKPGVDPAHTYLYMYNEFGQAGANWQTNATFEEWRSQTAAHITGFKFFDHDGDGVRDGTAPNFTDEGLGGFTIYIDANGNNKLDAGEQYTVTASDGSFDFGSLLQGTSYTIREVLSLSDTTMGATYTSGYLAGQTINIPAGVWDETTGTNDGTSPYVNDMVVLAGTTNVLIGNHLLTPDFTVVKAVTSITDGADFGASNQADSAGDVINYTVTIDNTGEVALTGFSYIDQNADGDTLTYVSGDLNNDHILDTNEVWVYSGTHTVTQAELDGKGTSITGAIDGDGDTDNRVTVDFNETDPKSSSVSTPLVYLPGVDLIKYVQVDSGAGYGAWEDANNPTGPQTSVNSAVNFRVDVTNTGNVTLTAIHINDLLHDYASNTNSTINYTAADAWVDLNHDGIRQAGESWSVLDANNDGTLDNVTLGVGQSFSIYYSLAFVEGQHTNTATVTDAQGVTDSDAANYYGLPTVSGPGVRTPGFWAHWTNLWDGTAIGDPKQMGTDCFPEHDLLYAVDSNGDGVIDGADKVGLLIGDWNQNGLKDPGEDVLFVSLAAAQSLVNASNKTIGSDGVQIVGRDLIASWLNFLEGNAIDKSGTADDSHNPQHFIQDAVNYLQAFAGSDNDGPADTFDIFQLAGHKVTKTSSSYWQTAHPELGYDHSGAAIHAALDSYNNTGTIDGIWYAGSCDDPAFMAAISQVQTP